MNIIYWLSISFLFFILTPKILFSLSKNKYIAAFLHAIIFSFTMFHSICPNFEPMSDDMYLDASCNNLLKEDSKESESSENSGVYFIDGSNCTGPEKL